MSNQQAVASFTDKLALGEAKRGERVRRVVVTGGSGKLGRATVKYLADEGWEVAENEVLYLCVDLGTRRVGAWPEDVRLRFAAHATGGAAKRLRLNPRAEATAAPAG